LENVAEGVLNARSTDGAMERMRMAVSSIRRPYRVLAAVAAIVTAGTIVVTVVAADDSPPTDSATAVLESARVSPAPETTGGEARHSDDEAIAGDDPVAAAAALVRVRATCLSDLSVLCLDGVDHLDSAAWEADHHAIRSAQESGRAVEVADFSSGDMTLVDRMGDTAIVALGRGDDAATKGPASVLVIRTEAGWRIRDVLED